MKCLKPLVSIKGLIGSSKQVCDGSLSQAAWYTTEKLGAHLYPIRTSSHRFVSTFITVDARVTREDRSVNIYTQVNIPIELVSLPHITHSLHPVSDWNLLGLILDIFCRSLVFSELTRGLWDERARLREGIMHADVAGSGVLHVERVRQILRAHRLPINPDLMDCMLQV